MAAERTRNTLLLPLTGLGRANVPPDSLSKTRVGSNVSAARAAGKKTAAWDEEK